MSKQVLGKKIFNDGLVQKDGDDFLAGEREYNVRLTPDKNHEFYCTCPAWKFDSEHDCKHCIAVRLFIKNDKQKFPTEDDD